MPDTNSIEEKIQKIESSHKLTRWLFVICAGLFVVVMAMLFWAPHYDNSEEKYVKALQDSMKVHDKKYAPIIDSLNKVVDSASARISAIEEGLSTTDAKLAVIKDKYDKVRNNIVHSTLDDKRKFFTGRLPQGTSTGR